MAEFGSGFQGVVVFIKHDGAVVVTVFSGSLFLTVFGHQVSLALLRKVFMSNLQLLSLNQRNYDLYRFCHHVLRCSGSRQKKFGKLE